MTFSREDRLPSGTEAHELYEAELYSDGNCSDGDLGSKAAERPSPDESSNRPKAAERPSPDQTVKRTKAVERLTSKAECRTSNRQAAERRTSDDVGRSKAAERQSSDRHPDEATRAAECLISESGHRIRAAERAISDGGSKTDQASERLISEKPHQRNETELSSELQLHIESLWNLLPDQSQKRLHCLAISAGTSVSVEDHMTLCGALEMIAEAEGTLESETEFAQYLGSARIAQWLAETKLPLRQLPLRHAPLDGLEQPKAIRLPSGVSRKEQTRLAVRRHREKKRAAEQNKAEREEQRSEARFAKVRELAAIAIDGEGVSLPDGSHIYRYMAACTSDGTCLGELFNETGITTREALDFVCGLPKFDPEGQPYLGVFGYGLGYDQTKWLEGLSNKELFDLFHAEDLEPKAKVGPYRLNLLGKCLQITNKKAPARQKRTLVWDILKAFQATFVNALKTWKVGTPEEWEQIEAMKKQRGKFADATWSDVTAYCRDECRLLAALVEKYVGAHCEAGIDLRGKYHGAGSTGDAFLMLMGAMEKRCSWEYVKEAQLDYKKSKSAFSRAFFGGRAEVSRLGIVEGPVWNYDIGSAYPHALYDLPCVKHGTWSHIENRVDQAIEKSRLACVHYGFNHQTGRGSKYFVDIPDQKIAGRALLMGVLGDATALPWGALPFRTERGSIVFPSSSPGGWVWREEYETAARLWPGVIARDAWCLRSECQCEAPYRQIGEYYLKRLDWGKEGPGLVLKLGLNSCYGKFAQVIGNNPKYACRVVAGVITSTTRSRIIEAIASARDPWDVVYVATDGIITNAPIDPPDPPANATKVEAERKGKVMLGAWEKSEPIKDTYFVVQPGFYFSTKDGGKAKTRGMPLEIVNSERGKILEQWKREPLEPPRNLPPRSAFRGVKTSILRPTKKQSTYRRKSCYGKWEQEEREIKYVINPKRSHPLPLRGGAAYRLLTWKLYPGQEESAEYAKDPSQDKAREWLDEQPDFVETAGTNVGD